MRNASTFKLSRLLSLGVKRLGGWGLAEKPEVLFAAAPRLAEYLRPVALKADVLVDVHVLSVAYWAWVLSSHALSLVPVRSLDRDSRI